MNNRPLKTMDGIIKCTRYAFMPNQLHLCGPEKQADILEFYSKSVADNKNSRSIKELMENFETMYPYLRLIARANNISDPFHKDIIEAYWLGNEKLEKVSAKELFNHLVDSLGIKKRLGVKKFGDFMKQFDSRALAHHNFHVLNVFNRTGKIPEAHTIASMDACRISWGTVLDLSKGKALIETRPLIIAAAGQIIEGKKIKKIVSTQTENVPMVRTKVGDKISFHWGSACEVLDDRQTANLQKCTDVSLKLANKLKHYRG